MVQTTAPPASALTATSATTLGQGATSTSTLISWEDDDTSEGSEYIDEDEIESERELDLSYPYNRKRAGASDVAAARSKRGKTGASGYEDGETEVTVDQTRSAANVSSPHHLFIC